MEITDLREKEKYYKALVEKDPQFIGVFYVGVKNNRYILYCDM